jgi:4-azaleucine resistance transporter AzlC
VQCRGPLSETAHGARRGLLAGIPIVIGYLPVAITFGALAVGAGMPIFLPILFSGLIFAGGTQFILLGALQGGTPWPYVVALCALIDARHLLYGPLLRPIFPERVSARVPLAFGLTDEVFGVALSKRGEGKSARLGAWLGGVTLAAYLSWVLGTGLGALIGNWLEQELPSLVDSLHFALPALFLGLTILSSTRRTVVPVLVGTTAAAATFLLANEAAAIAAAVGGGALTAFLREKRR